MNGLSEFEKLLSTGEKAQILRWVVQELGDGLSPELIPVRDG